MAYQPASNITTQGSFTHLATVYYDRMALDQLRTTFMFGRALDRKMLGKRNGKTIQWYRYSDFGANTTPGTEGQVGTGLTMTTTTVSATVAQYFDFLTISDFLDDTSISDEFEAASDQLGYRAGLTVDELNKAEIDSAAVSVDVALLGSFFSAKDGANVRHTLQAANVRPIEGNYFNALIHPYISYDLLNDPAAGGFQDIVKQYNQDGSDKLKTLPDRGFVGRLNSVQYWETTNVTMVAGTPNKWRTYFFGAGGVAGVDLEGRGPSRVERPDQGQRFRVNVIRPGLSIADPAGVIKGAVSYNFVYVAKILDSTNYRFRKIDSPSSIAA